MALLINKTTTYKGINLNQLYLRLQIESNSDGKKISSRIFIYIDKISFNDNSDFNRLDIEDIPRYIEFDYNRTTDGNDILTFIHNKVIEQLSTIITETFITTDEDTGEVVSTDIVTNSKFCEPNEISIVDID